jgi:toxin ParE1/3/4
VSSPKLPEFRGWRYRQIIEPPCRVIYRHEKGTVHVVHVVRGERLLDRALIGRRG